MGQTFIKKISWVGIHGLYYIVEKDNQIWWYFFLENIPILTRMAQNWTIKLLNKMKMPKNFKKNIQKILSMVMYIEKKYHLKKYLWHII